MAVATATREPWAAHGGSRTPRTTRYPSRAGHRSTSVTKSGVRGCRRAAIDGRYICAGASEGSRVRDPRVVVRGCRGSRRGARHARGREHARRLRRQRSASAHGSSLEREQRAALLASLRRPAFSRSPSSATFSSHACNTTGKCAAAAARTCRAACLANALASARWALQARQAPRRAWMQARPARARPPVAPPRVVRGLRRRPRASRALV